MTSIPQPERLVVNQSALDGYRDLLSVKDLTEIFGVSRQTIYKELKSGKLGSPITIGRAIKISKNYLVQRYFQTP